MFLDEIGDMPLAAQAKILRVLQDRAVCPLGSNRAAPIDVRIVSATLQNLEEAMAAGQFRQDLYYRIHGVELLVPPLRHRPEDVILLANYFLDRLAQRHAHAPGLSPGAVERLLGYAWPGNVRQLENVIEAAAVMATTAQLQAGDFPFSDSARAVDPHDFAGLMDLPLQEAKVKLMEAFERRMITDALDRHAGNVSAAARQLGIHRQSLQQKMTLLGIRRPV